MLSGSVIEYSAKYEAAGKLTHIQDIIKWGSDYLLKTFKSYADKLKLTELLHRMEVHRRLEAESVPISNVQVGENHFVLKLKILRRGPVFILKDVKHSQEIIFVDEEGSKIMTTIYKKFSHLWKTKSNFSDVCYFINGRIRVPFKSGPNVNKSKGIVVTELTDIKETPGTFNTAAFSQGFTTLHISEDMKVGQYYDIAGILIETRRLELNSGVHSREIVIMDESYQPRTVLLFDEQAIHEGSQLETAQIDSCVVAFCNVKLHAFDETAPFQFRSDDVTSGMINPDFERANELLRWYRRSLEDGIDVTLQPTNQFRQAQEMELRNMLDDSYDNPLNVFTKFTTTIKQILIKDKILYGTCKTCNEMVDIEVGKGYCRRCNGNEDDINYICFVMLVLYIDDRKIDGSGSSLNTCGQNASAEQNTITVNLFHGSRYLVRCNPYKYQKSFAEKGQLSEYYQSMISAEGAKFSFLVKNYHKYTAPERAEKIVVEELHKVENGPEKYVWNDSETGTSTSAGKRTVELHAEDDEDLHATGKKLKS